VNANLKSVSWGIAKRSGEGAVAINSVNVLSKIQHSPKCRTAAEDWEEISFLRLRHKHFCAVRDTTVLKHNASFIDINRVCLH